MSTELYVTLCWLSISDANVVPGAGCPQKVHHSDMFVVSSVIIGWSLNWLLSVYVFQCLVVQTCPSSCGTSNRHTSVSRQCTDTTTMSAVWRLFPAETLSYLPRETSPSKFGRLPLGMSITVRVNNSIHLITFVDDF